MFPKLIVGSTTWVSGLLINSPTYYRNLRLKVNFEKEIIRLLPNKRKKYHTVIIDEASMLSKVKLDWLQKSYPTYTFILVGDWNQLSPVRRAYIRQSNRF
jgi:ATP-dependent exoDNAse (exonuclease V) alpha subunit